MNAFKAVFDRETKKILELKQIWIIMTIVPIILCCIILYIFRDESPKNLPICVIDMDNSQTSREFSRMIDSAPAVRIGRRPLNEAEAKKDINAGKAYAVITIPKKFESDLAKGKKPVIAFKYNNQYLLTGGIIYKDIMSVYKTFSAKITAKKLLREGVPYSKVENLINPVSLHEYVKSNPYLNYAYFLVLGSFAHILQVLVAFTAIWAVGIEFKMGTGKEWLETAGNSIFIAVYAKLLPYMICYTIVGIFMFLVYKIVYNAPVNGNLLFLAMTLPLYILAYQSIGVIFVAITKNLRLSLSCGAFYTAMGFTFAGVTYPVFAMPALGNFYAQLLPIKHWLRIGLGQTLLGTPVRYQILICFVLLIFCILPLFFMSGLKKCASNERFWYAE